MLYNTITINDKEYKLRLSAQSCVELEKKLKTNPVNILMQIEKEVFPPLGQLLMIFHAALTEYNHGITEADVFKLYDEYVAQNKNYIDFVHEVIMPTMTAAGLLPNEKEIEEIEKNV